MTIQQNKLEEIMLMQSKMTVINLIKTLCSTPQWPNVMTDTGRSVIIEGLELLQQNTGNILASLHKDAITPHPVVSENDGEIKPLALVPATE